MDHQWRLPYLLLSQSIPIIKWYWLNSKGMDQLKTSLTVHTVIIRFTWVKKWFFEIGPIGLDGNECPAFCPLTVSNCPENHLLCPGGSDNNGCPMPATCLDMSLIGDSIPTATIWNNFVWILYSSNLGTSSIFKKIGNYLSTDSYNEFSLPK